SGSRLRSLFVASGSGGRSAIARVLGFFVPRARGPSRSAGWVHQSVAPTRISGQEVAIASVRLGTSETTRCGAGAGSRWVPRSSTGTSASCEDEGEQFGQAQGGHGQREGEGGPPVAASAGLARGEPVSASAEDEGGPGQHEGREEDRDGRRPEGITGVAGDDRRARRCGEGRALPGQSGPLRLGPPG